MSNNSNKVEFKELDKKSEVPILDFVVVADITGLIEVDFSIMYIIERSPNYLDHYTVELKDNEGGLMYLVLGTIAADDTWDWKAEGYVISIHYRGGKGKISSEGGIVGIATFNKKAIENGWVRKVYAKYIKTPDSNLGKSTKFYMMDYDKGNMEIRFDEPHGVVEDWEGC